MNISDLAERLHPQWRAILLRAWSVRAAIAGVALSGAQGAFYLLDLTFLPQWLFLGLVFGLFIAAPVLRVIVQPTLSGGDDAH